jgi:membrane protein DedA with SNARE-associated domain
VLLNFLSCHITASLWLLLLFLAGNSAGESVEDIAMRWYILGFAIHSSGLLIGWGLRRFEAFLLGGAA